MAEVSEERLRLRGAELWVRGIEGPPVQGPVDPFAHDGRFRSPEGNLVFEPRTLIYTLRLHNGSSVRWSVLAFQAAQALALLGFPEEDQAASRTARLIR